MRLGVDVDLTVVDTGQEWYNYLRGVSEIEVPPYEDFLVANTVAPYNMADVFKDIDYQKCLGYWREEHLYDNLQPLKDSVQVLEDLKISKGYEIIFVSTIKGNHHKSKYYFLKKNYPFLDGFIATKEKKYAKIDLMVDDRLNVLELLDRNVITVQKITPFDQTSKFVPSYSFDDWADFSKLAYRNF